MLTQLLYIHPAPVALGLFVVLVVASEVGDQVGRRAVAEANAIHTTALRGRVLPPAHRSAMAETLRAYVDARIDATEGDDSSSSKP